MSDFLKLIAPNTMGTGGGPKKGGQTQPPAEGQPLQSSGSTGLGTPIMPIADPNAWAKLGSGNFSPGQSSKGAMMKTLSGGGGGQ